MSQLVIPNVEHIESRENFGRFVAEPLEKGFGITLGNALRRILLGYLPGAAITQVKIEGIHHEFSTIPNMKEDTTDFLLNVKGLRLKSLSGSVGKLTMEVTGEGRISAADIQPSSDFEIVNPELYLATLDSPDAKLSVEFTVELGKGYIPAGTDDNMPIGTIPVDAIFTPVRKVNFTVEPIHIGQATSLERLSLEIWTDGTITPEEALSRSAAILVEQLTPFTRYSQVTKTEGEPEVVQEGYNVPVEDLGLSVRTLGCLKRAGINTVGEIMARGEKELLSLRNFGQKSKQELEERLESMGLTLKP